VGFVDQLNSSTYKTVAESKIKKKHFSFVYLYTVIGECSEDEDGFHYSIRGCTTKETKSLIKCLNSYLFNEFVCKLGFFCTRSKKKVQFTQERVEYNVFFVRRGP
jgi:hypothetical protein